MNYGLLAVASLRSKRALFPLNNPPTPTTLEVACNGALRRMRFILKNLPLILKFHERVISALKFELSGKRSQILVVNSCE